ncbi:hypothetical protein [Bacillus cabrialesii]
MITALNPKQGTALTYNLFIFLNFISILSFVFVTNPASEATKQAILNMKSEEFIEFKSSVRHLRTIPPEAGRKAFELRTLRE